MPKSRKDLYVEVKPVTSMGKTSVYRHEMGIWELFAWRHGENVTFLYMNVRLPYQISNVLENMVDFDPYSWWLFFNAAVSFTLFAPLDTYLHVPVQKHIRAF